MLESLKNALPINWGLVANPYNWVIVVLMLAIAAMAVAIVFQSASNPKPETN